MVLSDNGKTSRYTYNASGERIVKSHGNMEGVYVNGAPQRIAFHETDDFTLYPANILTVSRNRFTKHYFIGSQRIASRIGVGRFNNVYGINGSRVTAGLKDYVARMSQIEAQKEEYYKSLGIAPGVPTIKGSYGDPENTGVGYNSILTELGKHDVPENWIQLPKNDGKCNSTGSGANATPGGPVAWEAPSNPENAQPGYGYVAGDTTELEETFYYHSDHFGSTSYVTDGDGNITKYEAYLPYGELLVDEHSSSESMPYKFNGKQLDDETGLYYYGARYMNPVASIWYGVDPLLEKKMQVSPYNYCLDNPIRFIDYMGLYETEAAAQKVAKQYGANYYQDKKSKQWYVAMDESGEKAYSTGETLVRDFGQTFLEKSSGATDIGSNAYGFLEKMVIPGHKNYFLGINGKYYRHHPNGITGSRVGAIKISNYYKNAG